MSVKSSKGYSRVDSTVRNVHGWLVRIKRGKLRRSKFFSDATFGGKRKSLIHAKTEYQNWLAQLPPPSSSRGKLTSRNASGVVGVHFSSDTDGRYPNCRYESYIASWKGENGKRTNLRFSCNKYGKQMAFQLACIARELLTTDRDKIVTTYNRRQQRKSKSKSPKRAK